MEELTKVEAKIWEWIEKSYVGKPNAVTQSTLYGALAYFYPEVNPPTSRRGLRAIMRILKQKRPVLTSLKSPAGYYKPATWEEVESCLARRKYTALRMLSLNKKMLEVCKPLFPEQVSRQLGLFDKENKSINDSIKEMLECEKL